MYEIWSLGHKPFEGYTNIEAMIPTLCDVVLMCIAVAGDKASW